MPNYTRVVDGTTGTDIVAAHVNDLQVGVENLANGNTRTTVNRTTTVTAQAGVPDLSFPIGPDEVWTVEWYLSTACSGTGGIRYSIMTPTGAAVRGFADGLTNGSTARAIERITAPNTAFTQIYNNAAFDAIIIIQVTVVNGPTAGTVHLGFASGTAGQTSTIYANSHQNARKLF